MGACWELSIVEPRKPHLLSGTDHNSRSGIEGVAAFRVQVFQTGFGVGLWSLHKHFGVF